MSWGEDMAVHGFDIYVYDHTIEGSPKEDEHFHFHKIGLCNETKDEKSDLKTLA